MTLSRAAVLLASLEGAIALDIDGFGKSRVVDSLPYAAPFYGMLMAGRRGFKLRLAAKLGDKSKYCPLV